MSWEAMTGDDRVRLCEQCNLHVYNISEMTRKQAEALIAKTEGRICGRLYRRADGTVLTKDCPVGLRALRRRVSKAAGAAITALFSLCVSVMGQNSSQTDKSRQSSEPVKIQATGGQQPQDDKATLVGVIKDPNGAVVAGAMVALTNQSTGQKRETLSNDEGLYQFSSLEAGTYTIVVMAAGFQTSVVDAISVRVGVVNDGSVQLGLKGGIERGVVVGTFEVDEDFDRYDTSLGNKTTFTPKKITRLPY
jgi:RNA 3'-terminal phosphate cyclase